MSNLKVQKVLIAQFLTNDFDEEIAALPLGYQSYTYPVEQCRVLQG